MKFSRVVLFPLLYLWGCAEQPTEQPNSTANAFAPAEYHSPTENSTAYARDTTVNRVENTTVTNEQAQPVTQTTAAPEVSDVPHFNEADFIGTWQSERVPTRDIIEEHVTLYNDGTGSHYLNSSMTGTSTEPIRWRIAQPKRTKSGDVTSPMLVYTNIRRRQFDLPDDPYYIGIYIKDGRVVLGNNMLSETTTFMYKQ